MNPRPLFRMSELGSEFKLSPWIISSIKKGSGAEIQVDVCWFLLCQQWSQANIYLTGLSRGLKKIDFYKALWRSLDKGTAKAHDILIATVATEPAISHGMLYELKQKQGWAVENRNPGNCTGQIAPAHVNYACCLSGG